MVYKEYKTVLQPHMIKHRYNFSHDKISILKKKYADHMQKSGFDLRLLFNVSFLTVFTILLRLSSPITRVSE